MWGRFDNILKDIVELEPEFNTHLLRQVRCRPQLADFEIRYEIPGLRHDAKATLVWNYQMVTAKFFRMDTLSDTLWRRYTPVFIHRNEVVVSGQEFRELTRGGIGAATLHKMQLLRKENYDGVV